MPFIYKRVTELTGNTFDPNVPNSQSTWFSYVRTVYSPQRGGTIKPPTKTEFMRELRSFNNNEDYMAFACVGDDIEECKQSLSWNCTFPEFRRSESVLWRKDLKIATWVRMILAFNMYAEVRKRFNMHKCNRVDFIGSTNSSMSLWEARFHGRCVLYIKDIDINHMMDLIDDNRAEDFWLRIFEIYNGQFYINNFRRETQNIYTPISSEDNDVPPIIAIPTPPTPSVPRVDNPTHSIAQEYLSRVDDDEEEEIALDNQQIANMIMNTRDPLPNEIKKIIHETCMALHISHPVQSDSVTHDLTENGGWAEDEDDFRQYMHQVIMSFTEN